MKITLAELIHRLVYLAVSIAWTVLFFMFLQDLHSMADKFMVLIVGMLGFIALGRYDVRVFNAKWW